MNRRKHKFRKGAAVAEFAVCLPVMVVIVLGAIECTSMIFVEQSLNIVAYEGIRTAIGPDGTAADARQRTDQVIAERDLAGCSVVLDPANPEDADRGTPVTIRVTAPVAANSVFSLRFFSGDLEAVAVMNKE